MEWYAKKNIFSSVEEEQLQLPPGPTHPLYEWVVYNYIFCEYYQFLYHIYIEEAFFHMAIKLATKPFKVHCTIFVLSLNLEKKPV